MRRRCSELLELTEANDVELRLARLKPNVSTVLAADGLIDRIGPGNIHGNVHRAVEAAQAANTQGSVDGVARPEGFEPPTY